MNKKQEAKIPGTKKGTESRQAVRTYKDTVFRMLFREPEQLLELYNAVSGGHYTDPAQLEIVTLENAVYMNMKNDLAFLIDFRLNLYEHQGTVNPRACLKIAFCRMCAPLCGRFGPNERGVVGYVK